MIPSDGREQAVKLLSEAASGGAHPPELPLSCRPGSLAEALAIQDLLVTRQADEVAGWKVGTDASGAVLWGAIFAADCFASPARITGDRWQPLGVEGEIAFRFKRDLPCQAAPYTRSEIEDSLIAFPAMEIVSSRFADYRKAPFLDRVADRVSNGGMVIGTPCPDWRSFDLARLRVTLGIDGSEKLNQIGGHPKVDPLLPAVELIHARQAEKEFRAGQFLTTGSFTGLIFGKSGQRVTIDFQGFGAVELMIE